MAKKEGKRVRDLAPETQLEIKRAQAKKMVAQVKLEEAKREIEEHKANIDRLKET